MNLLYLAGFRPHAVLISSWGNGDFATEWKQILQFNHLLVSLTLDNKTWFLDTSDKYLPFGTLPYSFKVPNGVLVDGEKSREVKIKLPGVRNEQKVKSDAEIDKDGAVHVKSNLFFSGEDALHARNRFGESSKRRKNLEDFLNKTSSTVELDTFYIHNLDALDKPFSMDVEFHIKNFVMDDSGLKHFKPPFLTAIQHNKFKSQERFFPVDFGYKDNVSESIKIALPKDVQVELPGKTVRRMREVFYSKTYFEDQGFVSCRRLFKILKFRVTPEYYPKLRNIYNVMVADDQNEILMNQN